MPGDGVVGNSAAILGVESWSYYTGAGGPRACLVVGKEWPLGERDVCPLGKNPSESSQDVARGRRAIYLKGSLFELFANALWGRVDRTKKDYSLSGERKENRRTREGEKEAVTFDAKEDRQTDQGLDEVGGEGGRE